MLTPGYHLRGHVHQIGMAYLKMKADDIAKELGETDKLDQLDQTDLIKLQMKVSEYNNTVSLMTGVFKGLSDTDKEVIRNT